MLPKMGRETLAKNHPVRKDNQCSFFRGIPGMSPEKRSGARVEFSRAINVQIVAIDGTWRRACVMLDVADGGAKLSVTESLEGLNLKEFFLILSATGLAFRRCELAWINGDQLGVRFLENPSSGKKKQRPSDTK
jgi:PilZ domain